MNIKVLPHKDIQTKESNKEITLSEPENLKKLISLLEIIKNIEIKDNIVKIEINKDIIIYNEGSLVQFNKGYSVNFAKEIHLNPKMKFSTFKNLPKELEESKKV